MAAVTGLVAGFILHFSSTIVVSVCNLESKPEDEMPLRAPKEPKTLRGKERDEDYSSGAELKWKLDPSVEKKYSEWLEKKRADDRDLFKHAILEEDSDSLDGF